MAEAEAVAAGTITPFKKARTNLFSESEMELSATGTPSPTCHRISEAVDRPIAGYLVC